MQIGLGVKAEDAVPGALNTAGPTAGAFAGRGQSLAIFEGVVAALAVCRKNPPH